MEQIPLEVEVHPPGPVARDREEEAAAPRVQQPQNNHRVVTKTPTVTVYIVRILEVILTCISFSLVASLGHSTDFMWSFCMCLWCFCFCGTLLILLLECTRLRTKYARFAKCLNGFPMLAVLMVWFASFFYPIFFVYSENSRGIVATVTSWLAFILYNIDVLLTFEGSILNRLWSVPHTVPVFLKFQEAVYACYIFLLLINIHISKFPGLQWCVAVYCICFIFTVVITMLTICRIQSPFPVPFDKVLTVYNALAVLMYITAVVIWPLYSFQNSPSLGDCMSENQDECLSVVIIFYMTCFNLVVYTMDTVTSFKLVFFSHISTDRPRNL